jgi:MFS family permease
VLLAEVLPGMLAGPLIGAWVDRHDRARCAVVAEAVRGAALAAMIVVPGKAPLVVLALVTGIATTVLRPAAFALLPAVVAPERRMAATALWSAAQDLGMTLGPALAAGVLVFGDATLVLGLSAGLLACSSLLFTRVRVSFAVPVEDGSLVDGARAGLRLVGGQPVLRVLTAAMGVIVLAAGMMNVAEVVLAQRELHLSGAGFAALVAVFGIGAVLGSLASGASDTPGRLVAGYIGGLTLLGAGLLGSALAPSLPVALGAFFATGCGNSLAVAHDRGLVQHLVPAGMLARVHALGGTIEAWALAGAALVGGTVASLLGARGVFAAAGLALLLIAAVTGRTLLRPARAPILQPNPT